MRRRVMLAYVVLLPLVSFLNHGLRIDSESVGLAIGAGLSAALLLFLGPRALPLVVLGQVVDGGVDRLLDQPALAIAEAAVAAGALALVVWWTERRFTALGRQRSTRVVVEFLLLLGVLGPLVLNLTAVLFGGTTSGEAFAHNAIADALGIVVFTPGLRMVVMGERPDLNRRDGLGMVAASVFSAVLMALSVLLGGPETLANSQVALLPVLVMAFLAGTAVYTIGIMGTALLIGIPASLVAPAGLGIPIGGHLTWWMAAAGGLLLASEGDRLRAVTTEYQALFRFGATPTVEADAGTAIVRRANDAMAGMTGWSPTELEGCDLRDLLVGDDEDLAHFAELLTGARTKATCNLDVRCLDGSLRSVRFQGRSMSLGGPQPEVVLLQFTDMTVERQREAALRRSNTALERFGRRVSHDLKQPLAAIAGYAATLREHSERLAPDVVDTMHERLDAAARRAVDQLDEMFTGAAIDGDGPRVLVLDDLVARVRTLVAIELDERDGQIVTALAAPRLHANGNELQQVLLNLVTNSLKYSDPGRPPRIRIASRIRGAGVELTITDNGLGIPGERLDQVFIAGRRLAPDAAPGRGVGLSDSRAIVEAAGGWLRAEPWSGGSRFVIWMPDAMAAEERTPLRVLLVDDDVDHRAVISLRLMLEDRIDVVGEVGTIAAAVEATADLAPDVVLLDRWLPDGDGLSAVPALAAAHPDVRVIVLTADQTPGLDAHARSGGVLRTIPKNQSADELVRELVGVTT